MSLSLHVAGTGFTVMDRVYATGEPRYQALGGSCGNVLLSLAMLSHNVAPVLRLGDDDVGDELVLEFAQAGAWTQFIRRWPGRSSPVLAQHLDTRSGQHSFSFSCPETERDFPRYEPIDGDEVDEARSALNACQVFYTDRVSPGIVQAMETAADAGAVIYFEPSAIGDRDLFSRAMALSHIIKCSSDRLDDLLASAALRTSAVAIVTRGADGLDLWRDGARVHCAATPASVVRDTCGSGDMVTVGLIDRILDQVTSHRPPAFEHILEGVIAGQRLAAANCAYPGARGLFRMHGADTVRRLLDDPEWDLDIQLDLF